MEANEFRIDKTKVLTKEYKLDQTNPGKAIQYVRNSNGMVMVDANNSNIDSQRLVINLVNTRYKLLSFNNVLKTNFEEFLDPEITVPDEQQLQAQDLTGTVLDLSNQVKNKDQIIDNLNQTIDNLSNALTNVNTGSLLNNATATSADNKKPRIFSDGTLIQESGAPEFYYIIEDGKKRWFQFNRELLNIVAKSSGKQKTVNGTLVPDLIEVSQDILDDIPSGAPFTNFDLVKNVQTPAPPPFNLPDNKRLDARWASWLPNPLNGAPLVIETTNTTPTDEELTIQLNLSVISAEGIVNRIEVWEDGPYYQNKPQLPIYDPTPKTWNRSKLTAFNAGTDYFKVMLRKTNDPVTDVATSNDFNQSGQTLLAAYSKIKLSLDNPEYTIKLAAKILNDVNDEYYQTPDQHLTVIIRYVPKMPDVTNLTVSDARTAITATGVLNTNINESNLILTNDSLLYDKVQRTTPINGADIDKNSIINLITYKRGTLTVPTNISFYSKFNDIVRVLKRAGFNNISVNQIYRGGYTTQDLSVSEILKSGNVTLTAGSTYSFDDPIYLKVDIWANGSLIGFTPNTQQTDATIIQYLNNVITTII